MKKILCVLGICFLQGCGDSHILCWYSKVIAVYGPKQYFIFGRTPTMHEDVIGLAFDDLDDLQDYIDNNNLNMCGIKE